MCLIVRIRLCLLALLFCTATSLFAQQNNSGIKLFFEKIYLHTDRSYYASGDAIWFKAYLVNGQSNYPVNTSNTLYTELINPSNVIIESHVLRIDSGYAAGDFKLPDSAAGGTYRIRAYTNWMKNFGQAFVFEKQLPVTSVVAAAAAVQTPVKAAEAYSIHFFPEGGSLITGINAAVAFKAEDINGKGVDASGTIINTAGDTVAHFKTQFSGMGSFNFTAVAGMQYKVLVNYPQHIIATTDFIPALSEGYALKITTVQPDSFALQVAATAGTMQLHPSGNITIAAKHGGRILYKTSTTLNNLQASIRLSVKNFPPGICSITLYDDSLRPNCERLIFVQDKNPLHVTVSTNKTVYKSKERVVVNISVTDSAQHPVQAALSLAAVDEQVEKAIPENISTYLLLQSELKGSIENAAAYFDVNNPQRFQQLDLLLRAQGWRDFLWRRMADANITLRYLPEQGISISGNVKQRSKKIPLPIMNITLQAPAAKGDKWYTTRTDEKGNYFLDGLPLYGVQTIKISSKNDKAEKGGEIFMDSLFAHPLVVTPNPFRYYDTASFLHFAKDAGKRYAVEKNNKWTQILPGVTVTSKTKTVFMRDGAYMSFGYPENNFTITSADYAYDDLRNFLGKKVPGTYYDMENDAVYFMANGKKVRPRFVVEKKEDVFDRIDYYSLSMKDIVSVSVKHLIGQPSFNRTEMEDGNVRDLGASPTDLFVISLILKPSAYNTDPAKIITEINGYYEAKVFYAPNYNNDKAIPDERTTIHWAPLISTDVNGKARVSFFNADPATTIRIDVQGVTAKGNTIVAEKKYEVR